MTLSRSEFFAGVRAELPISLGVIPFGMIYGVLALGAGLPTAVAMTMSSIVFAGSSQLIGTPLIGAGAPFIVIWLTTLMVNLRHLLYSASVAPYVKHLRPRWKWLLAYVLTDEAYAVTITHYNREELPLENKHWYYLGAGLTLWSAWQVSTAIGLFLGEQIPASWGLDFTLALTFIALVVPRLKDRPSLASSFSAGVVAVLTNAWPYKTGLMVAALIGITLGLGLEQKR
jgi:4-azaleucine resistance transporter AzlC